MRLSKAVISNLENNDDDPYTHGDDNEDVQLSSRDQELDFTEGSADLKEDSVSDQMDEEDDD